MAKGYWIVEWFCLLRKWLKSVDGNFVFGSDLLRFLFCVAFFNLTDNFGRFQKDDDWRSRVAHKVDSTVLQSPGDG